jgi:hypothetical protein
MAISNSLAGNVLDASRLNAIFQCELASFLENLPEYNLSETSEASGDLISWLSVFAPEAINEESKSKLHEIIYKLKSRSTYKLVGWFQELPLKIALYGIDRDYAHLGSHIENLSYGESGLRWYIMDSLALVAGELSIRDERLRWAAARNLEKVHGGCELCAAMVLMTTGPKEFKLECLQEWLGRYKINQWERDYLQKLAAGESLPNYFVHRFFRQQTYLLDRFCRANSVGPDQGEVTTLFDMRPMVQILERIRSHPLMQSHLQIASS